MRRSVPHKHVRRIGMRNDDVGRPWDATQPVDFTSVNDLLFDLKAGRHGVLRQPA